MSYLGNKCCLSLNLELAKRNKLAALDVIHRIEIGRALT